MNLRPFLLALASFVLGGVVFLGCTTASRSNANAPTARARPTSRDEAELEKRVHTLAHYAAGLSYDLNDKSDLALEEMLRAAETDPSNETVVIETARRCLREKKLDKAIDFLTRASEQPDASGAVYAWLGLAYAQAGKTDLAIAANRTAIRKTPQSLAPYQNLAQVYLQNSRTNDALRVLDEAARQPADEPGFLIDLAELFLRYGRGHGGTSDAIKKRVEEVLDRAADLAKSNPLQTLRLAEAYFALGELKKAEPFYRQLLDDHPDLPSLRGKLTEIYLRSGQKEKATEQLEALARNEPTNPQAYILLGSLAAEEEKYADAAENFERALKLDPDLEQVYYDLAGLKLSPELNKPEEALAVLEKARARFKRSFLMDFYTGLTYSNLKNYPEALKYLTSAEAIGKTTDPERLNHVFYFQLGAVQERAGNVDEAERYFRQCLELAPDDPEALNYLGYMWAEKGIKLDEARVLIEKAVRLQPDSAAFLDSLGWVLFRLGKPAEALPNLVKAIENSKKPDATLYDHLGDIYSSLQKYDQAREAWRKSLEVEPNDQIQKKLRELPNRSQSSP